ncbi:DUF6205 family protein [Streptomyces rhizosphaericus]|uniref:DUF6205 family protein n=1 Tax=Streptomyces rhizosphaericus TaxID=114699 RepID=UPI000A368475|nr:DUF6205 family protein [Streptomyces rhizosphaericus]
MGGYDSYFTGEVRITPPLTWEQIKNTRQSPGLHDVKLRTEELVEDTRTGQVWTITADAVVPAGESAYNGSDIEDELQAVIDVHPEHNFTGTIEAWPEDRATPWRYIVQGRRVVRQEAKWPGDQNTLTDLARRIIALDDPDGRGAEERRTVTLDDIIGWARKALGDD